MADDGWTAWDSFKDWMWQTFYSKAGAFLWGAGGKAIVTAAFALISTAIAYIGDAKHKEEIALVCTGVIGACVLIFIWSWIQSKYAPTTNDYSLHFYRLTNAETIRGFGLVMEINAQTEHEMTEILIAYRALVSNWNDFWAELKEGLRRHRTDEERLAIATAINERYQKSRLVASENLERRLEQALSGMRTLYDDSGRAIKGNSD